MSDLLPRPPAPPARAEDARDEAPNNPLKKLPKEWRPLVSFFWAGNEGLLRTPLELVTRLRFWMDPKESIGLTLDELKPIVRALLQPGEQAKYEFGSQLLAELARRVAAVPAGRKKRAAAAAQAGAPPSPEELARMRQLMAVNKVTQSLFAKS